LRHQQADTSALARFRNIHAFQRWIIPHSVRCVSMRHLPHELSFIQTDGGKNTVRRFHERQTLNGGANSSALRLCGRCGRCCRRCTSVPTLRSCRCSSALWLREVCSASEPGSFAHPEWLSRGTQNVFDIGEPFRWVDQPDWHNLRII